MSAVEQHDWIDPAAEDEPHGGAITFAGAMFLFAGTFNLIAGIAALVDDNYFRADELLFGDLTFWGWTWVVLGSLQLLTAWLVFSRSAAGFILGVLLAGVNAMAHLLSVGAYPIWSIIVIVIDFLIIWALVTSSDRKYPAAPRGDLAGSDALGSPGEYQRTRPG